METRIIEELCMTEEELNQIGDKVDLRQAGTRLINEEIGMDDVLRKVFNYLDKKEQAINTLSKAVEALKEENEKLKERIENGTGLSEYTLDYIGRIRKDSNIKQSLSTGVITVDKMVRELIEANEKHTIDKVSKQELLRIGYQLKGDDCFELIIPDLASKIQAKDLKIKKMEERNSYLETRLKAGQEACREVEKQYPGFLGIYGEEEVVNNGYALFDSVIDALLNKLNLMEVEIEIQKRNTSDLTNNDINIENAVMILHKNGIGKMEISKKLDIDRTKVYRIIKKHEEMGE